MSGELNVLALILGASLFVKLVMGVLLLFSFLSWVIIFRKKAMLDRAIGGANEFEERFWSGADLAGLFREVSGRGNDISGIESIFEGGFREFARLRQRRGLDPRTMLEGAQRAMRVAATREMDRLEQSLEFLANVGSISPYVGLLGTVWGIMTAFQGLANVKEATIAMVAPGISEALIATAMGLVAAIPASWAYNRYSNKLERVAVRYDTFVDEFSSILQRQAHADDHG
ncbi:MAG TPA: protein TolQ [Rhodanobacteraceae bacterium]|nr:protein TolQ [Rhodanobacteraceae bacterium]